MLLFCCCLESVATRLIPSLYFLPLLSVSLRDTKCRKMYRTKGSQSSPVEPVCSNQTSVLTKRLFSAAALYGLFRGSTFMLRFGTTLTCFGSGQYIVVFLFGTYINVAYNAFVVRFGVTGARKPVGQSDRGGVPGNRQDSGLLCRAFRYRGWRALPRRLPQGLRTNCRVAPLCKIDRLQPLSLYDVGTSCSGW